MELFTLEHKRLWRKTSTRICVLLCFIYCVLYGGVLSFQWYLYGSEGEDATSAYGNNFDGYSMIRQSKELADSYGGYLTDETLQRAVEDWRTIEPKPHLQSAGDWQYFQTYISSLFPELTDPEQYYDVELNYIDPDELTGFYERRQDFLERNLEVNRQSGLLTEDDVQKFLDMSDQLEEPWRYEWVHGWANFLSTTLASKGSSMAPYLAIVLAFTFSGEWRSNTAPLLHTTKHGWKKLARVKILSGLAFAVELYALIAGGLIAAQLIYMGTSGWDMPIQLIKLIAVVPWNMLQAELYELAFIFLGVIGYAGVVMFLSSLVKSNVLSLTISLALIEVPGLLGFYLPLWAQDASQFIPLVGSPTDIFRMNMFHIFGKGIWMPYLLITVPVLIGIVCIPFATRGWARRQKA